MYRTKIRFVEEGAWKTFRTILLHSNVDYESGVDSKGYYYVKVGKQRKPYVI